MSKLSKAFKALGLVLRKPSLLNHVLNDEQVLRKEVIRKYGSYDGLPVVDLRSLLADGAAEVSPYAFLDGGCMPTDLALLRSLCVKHDVKDYLEIGTWRGESVANVAACGASCVSVNLPDAEMRAMGLDERYIGMHRFFSEKLSNVQHIQANSHHFDFTSLNKKFDLIFIDGDHHTESIAKDTATAFSLLKNESSLIVWHDYAFSPETPRYEVLAGILQACPAGERGNLYHVSNTMCALYSKEKLPAQVLVRDAKPEKFFSLQMKIKSV